MRQPTKHHTTFEERLAFAVHREAADTVKRQGGHYGCAQAIGFIATAKPGEVLSSDLGRPCPRCVGIFQAFKKKTEVRAA